MSAQQFPIPQEVQNRIDPDAKVNGSTVFKRFSEVMKELEAIGKDSLNQGEKYKFRSIDAVYNAVHPLLAKHELFTIPIVLEHKTEIREITVWDKYEKCEKQKIIDETYIKMKYRIMDSGGSYFDSVVIGQGRSFSAKSANVAMSFAHKYALLQMFCIPTEDISEGDSGDEDEDEPKEVFSSEEYLKSLEEKTLTDLANYPCTFGKKFKGLKMKDIRTDDLSDYCGWIQGLEEKSTIMLKWFLVAQTYCARTMDKPEEFNAGDPSIDPDGKPY